MPAVIHHGEAFRIRGYLTGQGWVIDETVYGMEAHLDRRRLLGYELTQRGQWVLVVSDPEQPHVAPQIEFNPNYEGSADLAERLVSAEYGLKIAALDKSQLRKIGHQVKRPPSSTHVTEVDGSGI